MQEWEKARAWRERMGFTQNQLGKLTGYTRQTIYWMERGVTAPYKNTPSRPISDWVWQRYKLACWAAEMQHKGNTWDWG